MLIDCGEDWLGRFDRFRPVRDPVTIAGFVIEARPVQHSLNAPAVGFKVSAHGACLFYVPDVAAPEHSKRVFENVDVYVGDGAVLVRSLVRSRGSAPQSRGGCRPVTRNDAGDFYDRGLAAPLATSHLGPELRAAWSNFIVKPDDVRWCRRTPAAPRAPAIHGGHLWNMATLTFGALLLFVPRTCCRWSANRCRNTASVPSSGAPGNSKVPLRALPVLHARKLARAVAMPPSKTSIPIRVCAGDSIPAPDSSVGNGHEAARRPVPDAAGGRDSRRSSTHGFAHHTRSTEETAVPARSAAPSHVRADRTEPVARTKRPDARAQPPERQPHPCEVPIRIVEDVP